MVVLLCVPLVIGPVTELMKTVRVQGCLPGAFVTVSVTGTGHIVAKGAAHGGDDWFPLLPGEALHAGDALVAKQELAGDSSPAAAPQLAVTVAAAPMSATELGYVGTSTHLYQCGQAVWIEGAIPGAIAQLSWGGVLHGQGVAGPDGARFALDTGLPAGPVSLRQVTPVGGGPEAQVTTDPAPLVGRELATPVVGEMHGCDTAALVTGVVDGARVTLTHASGATESAWFDRPGLWFITGQPLRKGDKITARQELVTCKLSSPNSAPQVVGDPSDVPAPVVLDPLCVGAVSIRVTNLSPGALVHLDVNGTAYTGIASSQANWTDLYVAPLTGGTVTATQELCEVTSPPSTPPITVHSNGPVTDAVVITAPLMACARAVSVTEAHVGALLQVWARNAAGDAPISAIVVADKTEMTLPVAPYLREGEQVRVIQYGCSATAATSKPEKVIAHGAPQSPVIVTPVYAGSGQVTVGEVFTGALIDVYVGDGKQFSFAGSAIADSVKPTISLTVPLSVGQQVCAVQTLCGSQSRQGKTATVVVPPPKSPVIKTPVNGATGVGVRPTFTWADGGAGTPGPATSYTVAVAKNGSMIIPDTSVSGTSWTPASDLPYGEPLWFTMTARNASGSSDRVGVNFTTEPRPAPVAPTLLAYNVTTMTLTGSGFLPSTPLHVRLSMLGNSVYNSYGVLVLDTRDGYMQATSDASGAISVVVNPNVVLVPLLLDEYFYLHGVARGEVMHFSANDGRPNSSDLTGILWSNTLSISAP